MRTAAAAPGNGDEPIEGEVVEASEVSAGAMMATLNKAEIDTQIATARRYPRVITAFREEAMALATLDEETAGSMFYALKRGGKTIEGPSVRLAEIAGSSWGHMRYGARVVDIDRRFVTAQGMAFDVQKNVAVAFEVKRRITNSSNVTYSDDMIGVTANAAMSIALRNAIFKVIPFAFVKPIYEAAKLASLGKGVTMEQRRQRALGWFTEKQAAKPEDVFRFLSRKGPDDITIEDLTILQGLRTAIMDGETSWVQALRDATQVEARETQTVTPGSLSVESLKGGSVSGMDDGHGKTTAEVSAAAAGKQEKQDPPKQGALGDF